MHPGGSARGRAVGGLDESEEWEEGGRMGLEACKKGGSDGSLGYHEVCGINILGKGGCEDDRERAALCVGVGGENALVLLVDWERGDVGLWGIGVVMCVQVVEHGGMCMGVGFVGNAVRHLDVDHVGVCVVCVVDGDPVVGVDIDDVCAYTVGWRWWCIGVRVDAQWVMEAWGPGEVGFDEIYENVDVAVSKALC